MIIEYNGKRPRIGRNVYIAPTAAVIGDVQISDGASVWFSAVIRGDMAPVQIGRNTNIQDNCTIHTDFGMPTVIGDRVTVGHNAVVHGCTVEDECLVGMAAVILNGAKLLRGSILAAGSVLRLGDQVGPNQLAAGNPAIPKKFISEEALKTYLQSVDNYLTISEHYRRTEH